MLILKYRYLNKIEKQCISIQETHSLRDITIQYMHTLEAHTHILNIYSPSIWPQRTSTNIFTYINDYKQAWGMSSFLLNSGK